MPYLFLYSTAKNRNNNIFFSLRKKFKIATKHKHENYEYETYQTF